MSRLNQSDKWNTSVWCLCVLYELATFCWLVGDLNTHIHTRSSSAPVCVCVCVCVRLCVLYEFAIHRQSLSKLNTHLWIHMYERAALRQPVGNLNTYLWIHIYEYISMHTHVRTCCPSARRYLEYASIHTHFWIFIYEYTSTNLLLFVSPSVTWICIYEYSSMYTHLRTCYLRQPVGNLNTTRIITYTIHHHLLLCVYRHKCTHTHMCVYRVRFLSLCV